MDKRDELTILLSASQVTDEMFHDAVYGDVPVSTSRSIIITEVTDKDAEIISGDGTRHFVLVIEPSEIVDHGAIQFISSLSRAIGSLGIVSEVQVELLHERQYFEHLLMVVRSIGTAIRTGGYSNIHQDVVIRDSYDLSGSTVPDDDKGTTGEYDDYLYDTDEDGSDEPEEDTPERAILKYLLRDADDEDDEDDEDEDDEDDDHLIVVGSRALREASHPKRDIREHGIVIASKDDIRKDRKIIKRFIREFIPGKGDTFRRYRSMVLKRWLGAFAVSKGTAREMEKEFKHRRNSRVVRNVTGTLSRYLDTRTVPRRKTEYNLFYDPTK